VLTAATLAGAMIAGAAGPAAAYQELTDRFNEADTLNHLGDAHHDAGDIQAARATWARAVRILDEIDHPDGDRVRAKLDLARGPAAAG
jgi:hypothetical protein